MVEEICRLVQKSLAAQADPQKAPQMQAYMKTDMPFYGVQSPARKKIAAQVKKRFPIKENQTYRGMVRSLWDLHHREEKYLSIELGCLYEGFISLANLDLYEAMIREGAWWDFVDAIAAHLVGEAVIKDPHRGFALMDQWIDDPDMWIRRSAIICQLTLKERTDQERLFDYCRSRCHESEFFIRKAIGWALRQHSYIAPQAVKGFLLANRERLSGLSYREGAKRLIKQGLL